MKRKYTKEYELEVIIPYYREHGKVKTMISFPGISFTTIYSTLKQNNTQLKGQPKKYTHEKGLQICKYYSKYGHTKTLRKYNMKFDTLLYRILGENNIPLSGHGYDDLDEIAMCEYYLDNGRIPTMIKFNIKNACTLYNKLKKHNVKPNGRKGKNNILYTGGKIPEIQKFRQSKKYRELRKEIFERDNYECQLCTGKDITPHHIFNAKKYLNRFFEKNNLITLCKHCHGKMIHKEEDYIDYLSQLQSDRGLPL